MRPRHTMDMTTGSVTKKLLVFVFPLIITNMLQHLYNAADSVVVGRFSGKVALAAVGATSSATSLITNLLIGLAVGAILSIPICLAPRIIQDCAEVCTQVSL